MVDCKEALLVKCCVRSFIWVTEVALLSGEQEPNTMEVLVLGETVDIPISLPWPSVVSNFL